MPIHLEKDELDRYSFVYEKVSTLQVILKRRVKLYEYQSVLLTLLSVIHEYSQIFLHVLNIYFALNYLDNEKRNNSAMSLFLLQQIQNTCNQL